MASYDMENSPAAESKEPESKKISFRFCRECSNMLYPKEDRTANTLMFACRTCHFSEEAKTACIYRNSLKETIAETPGNVQDVAQDPTVGDMIDENDLSSFADLPDDTAPHDAAYDSAMDLEEEWDTTETIAELCTYCGQDILCPFCEGPTDRGLILEADDPAADLRQRGEQAIEEERRERALSGVGFQRS